MFRDIAYRLWVVVPSLPTPSTLPSHPPTPPPHTQSSISREMLGSDNSKLSRLATHVNIIYAKQVTFIDETIVNI